MGGARVGEGCRSNPSHHGLPCEVRGRAGDAAHEGEDRARESTSVGRGRGCGEGARASGEDRASGGGGGGAKSGQPDGVGGRRQHPTGFLPCALLFIIDYF